MFCFGTVGLNLQAGISVFIREFRHFVLGMRSALYGGMTMLTAFLMYGETANGSQYRLTIWAYDKAEANKRASAYAQSNRLTYYKVL